MTGPDHEAIRAALRSVPDVIFDIESGYSYKLVASEADALTPTVAALMEDYAADLRAEVERLRGENVRLRGRVLDWMEIAEGHRSTGQDLIRRAEAAEADRDAYAAEKVRAALLDAAEAIEAHGRTTSIFCDRDEGYKSGTLEAADILRDRAGAS